MHRCYAACTIHKTPHQVQYLRGLRPGGKTRCVPRKRTASYSQFRLCFVDEGQVRPLFTPSRTQHTHFEPHHHSVAVQSHGTRGNTGTTLITRARKTSHRSRDRAGERLAVKYIYGDITGGSRTGEKAFVTTNTGMQFLRHLGYCLVKHHDAASISLQTCSQHLTTFPYRWMFVRIGPETT